MAVRYSASRVLQRTLQRRTFSVLESDELDAIYASARPPTVCFLGPPVRARAGRQRVLLAVAPQPSPAWLPEG